MTKTSCGHVLVTGSGGFIGSNLCPVLGEHGWQVRSIARNRKHEANIYIEDLGAETDWHEAVCDMDAVIHMAARVHVLREKLDVPLERFRAVNVEATRRLAKQAAEAGVKRFIYISTIGVHGVNTIDKGFCETDVPNPTNDYALSKLEGELALHEVTKNTDMECVVLRPPLVYGPGVKANFLTLLEIIHRQIPLPLANIKNHRDFLYVGNLASAILTCLTHPNASGQTFLVADGQTISTPTLIHTLAEMMEKKAWLFPCPATLLNLVGKFTGKQDKINRLTGSLEVDINHITETLDWQPPYTMEQGLRETVEWFKTRS